jgi:polyhydroxyalkanoate synthesis regulator phasin
MEIITTAGISLIGSRIAITTSKVLLPGLGGLIGAPLIFASTMAIGAVAKVFFVNEGAINKDDMKNIYEECVKSAKRTFDKSKMHNVQTEKMAQASVNETPADNVKTDIDNTSPVARLEQLKEMLSKGLIEQAEYDETKKRILSQM